MFVVMGTVTADLMVRSDASLADLGGDGFRSSNLVFTDAPVNISMGGNGGNSAYALAGLGAPTALCGAVGQDLLGDVLVRWLQARYVDLDGLARSESHATSSSTIVMTNTANQVVFHHLGSTATARFEEMPDELFTSAEVLLVTSYSIMPELRVSGFGAALKMVHQAGGMTALDVGPAIGEPVTLAEVAPFLASVDYLIGNVHELASLTGEAEWRDAATLLLAEGARCVVIKRGDEGASLWTPHERVDAPAFGIQPNISVGAGDSFNAGLLFALHRGQSLADALRFGNAVAGLVVASPRGILDSPSLDQVEAFLADRR